jgi:hypothetical protein
MLERYSETGGVAWLNGKDGPELMANFLAEITREVRHVDGVSTQTTLTITGTMPDEDGGPDGIELPEIEVSAEQFASMKWVMPCWGVRCVIMPGGYAEDLKVMIQQRSKPDVQIVYRQTGWLTIDGKRTYLHAGGGITAKGNDPNITVGLPPELMRYDLRCNHPPAECVAATLALTNLTSPEIAWPLLAATLAPLYGPVDFAIHVTGRTGSFKSELTSLFQAHYGAGFDARTLPGSWSSTENAVQALAFYACNALFVLDDFVPNGTSWQQRSLQGIADKIIRAQGNQAGRARLTDTASLQQTMYPRGCILSTGEDTPEGHSVRGRMLILELRPGDIDTADLTQAQAERPYYCGTVAWLAQSLAAAPADIRPRKQEVRDGYRDVGHARTPSMLGHLTAVVEDFVRRAADAKLITQGDAARHAAAARAAIATAGRQQGSYLEDSDPVDIFFGAIRQVLAAGIGHVRSQTGGVPKRAELLGFTAERAAGEMTMYKARGVCIGWCNWKKNELYLDMLAGYKTVAKAAGAELALSKQTLGKRIKDAGALVRVDDARGRNTVRVVCEDHPRNVLVLNLATVLELKELADDGPDDAAEGDSADDNDPQE